MRRATHEWTPEHVARWLDESVTTSRRLPPVRVQGHFNVWPAFARQEWEAFSNDEPFYRSFAPGPDAIERMIETMRWMQWLEVEQRHLVWMRAKRYGWREIAIRFACNRTTAWRHWQQALQSVTGHLYSNPRLRVANISSEANGQGG